MKKLSVIILCLAILISVSACGNTSTQNQENTSENSDNGTTASTQSAVEFDFSEENSDIFTSRDSDSDYNENNAVKIELKGTSAVSDSNSVKISGSTVTITEDATHIISGTLTDGMIIVDAPDTAKMQIVLDNASITSSTSAPIYIKEADKVFLTLVGESTLINGGSFQNIDDSNIDSVIFSKQDLTFNGDGSLVISSPAGHGIVGKDDVVFTNGSYSIAAASHGIDANDSVRIKDAVISADTGKDGIHSENSDDSTKGFINIESGKLNIECEGDGISAGSYIHITGGEIQILAGGGYENGTKSSSDNWGNFGGGGGLFGGMRPGGNMNMGSRNTADVSLTSTSSDSDSSTSMKGIKAANSVLIEGGTFNIDSADDGLHSDISLNITNGNLKIASGDDGIHAEKDLNISGGAIEISNSYEGIEALDINISAGNITLTASDDGLNAAGGNDQSGYGGRDNMFGGFGGMGGSSDGSIVISGGTLNITASGDGIDANGTLEISGGFTTITGPTQGDTATLDYDVSGTITGGTFIGTGASTMAQSFSDSTQGVIAISAGNQNANTLITVTDGNGNTLISHSPALSFQIIIISSPELVSGESYAISVGSLSERVTAK